MFNKVQKMIEEQKPNNSTETAILPMQCYVQPFWKQSDIEIYMADTAQLAAVANLVLVAVL